jgi:hypothetical protein
MGQVVEEEKKAFLLKVKAELAEIKLFVHEAAKELDCSDEYALALLHQREMVQLNNGLGALIELSSQKKPKRR